MLSVFVFLFGLLIGSFLNVVITRLHSGQSIIQPASRCPHCHQPIRWFDNIPLISFTILSGRCRDCHKKISWQYPLVELATGLIVLWLYFVFGLSVEFFVFSIFSFFLLVIFVYDLKHYLILDLVVVPAMIFAALANLYLGQPWQDLLLGAIVGGGFFWFQFIVSRGRWIGGGDIRLGALMGLLLGWQLLLVALFVAYLAGAIIGLALIATGKKKMSSALPFGALLAPATLVSLVYGQAWLNWYLNFILF